MSEQPGPPTLSARELGLATLVALVVAGLALSLYILPASYGLDPIGAGQALGVEGPSPSDDTGTATGGSGGESFVTNRTIDVTETQLTRYEVSWPTTSQDGPTTEDYTAENETTTVELDLPSRNLSQIRVTLTWTDDNTTAGQSTQPDELELVLESPNGETSDPVRAANPQGGEGQLEANLTLASLPNASTVDAEDRSQARRQALQQAPDRMPEGPWLAHVRVVDAGDHDATASMPAGSDTGDEGTNWTLTSTASTYELSLEASGPSPVRQETRTFQVAPGKGFEHKVSLANGSRLTYEWNATEEVYYDFHGEPHGNASNFESYETGTRRTDAGNLTAPFEGTHGWYWENRGQERIEITLTTRGVYEDGFTT